MRRESFTFSGRLFFEAITSSGDVEILPGNPGEVIVELRGGPAEGYLVEINGSDLTVHPPTKRSGKRRFAGTYIKLHVPSDASGNVRTASGDVVVLGSLRELTVATASGGLRVQSAIDEDVDVRTASGHLKFRAIGGNVTINSASGDVVADEVGGDFRFNTVSGNARIAGVGGLLEAKTVSGDIVVDTVGGHSVRARTMSGDVRLGIPSGMTVDLDMQTMSGEVINRIRKGTGTPGRHRSLAISLKTVSGDLRLESAVS